MRGALVALALIGASAAGPIKLEYAVGPYRTLSSVEWRHVADIPVANVDAGYYPLEFSEGKVHGSIAGDGQALADNIWDRYKDGDWVGFRVGAEGITQLEMTGFQSSYQLAKALSNLEVGIIANGDDVRSASLSVPWDDFKTLESSSRRVGSVVIHKPVFATSPLIPATVPDIIEPQPTDERPTKPPPPQGFLGKYWWAILVGFLVMQLFNAQPDAQQASNAVQQQRQSQAATRS